MQNKTILFVNQDPLISGSTISLSYLIKTYKQREWTVYVLSPKSEKVCNFLTSCGAIVVVNKILFGVNFALNVHSLNNKNIFSFSGTTTLCIDVVKIFIGIIDTYWAITKYHPDIVYANEYVAVQSSMVAWILGIPCITHIRSLFLYSRHKIRRRVLAHAITKFNSKIFAITSLEAQQIIDICPESKKKIIVIPEFLHANDFKQTDKNEIIKKYQFPTNRTLILVLGEIELIKGQLTVLRALEILMHWGFAITVIFAGRETREVHKGEYYDDCVKIIKRLPKDSIIMLHDLTIAREVIVCCDMLVSAITLTHFSRPIIEAWALKKPVVSSNGFHASELVDDNVNGLLFKVNDHLQLAGKIKYVITNKEIATKLGEAGYQKAVNIFGNINNLENIVQIGKDLAY